MCLEYVYTLLLKFIELEIYLLLIGFINQIDTFWRWNNDNNYKHDWLNIIVS